MARANTCAAAMHRAEMAQSGELAVSCNAILTGWSSQCNNVGVITSFLTSAP